MHSDTRKYNKSLALQDRNICNLLAREIDQALPEAENKIWHACRLRSIREVNLLAAVGSQKSMDNGV
jgi:hypothetical protein